MISRGGFYSVFDGSAWTAPKHLTSLALGSISCPADGVCMAVTGHGIGIKLAHAFLLQNGTWTESEPINDYPDLFTSVSCPSEILCTAVDALGIAYPRSAGMPRVVRAVAR